MRCFIVAGLVVLCAAPAKSEVVDVRIVVALCDVATQGVVPPPDTTMCDAARPERNLYWGARYGVKTFLPTQGWRRTAVATDEAGVVERLRLTKTIAGKDVVVVADAYASMSTAIEQFLGHAAADGADVVVFVGHDGLMEQAAPPVRGKDHDVDVAVFACLSERYFGDAVKNAGARRRLLTRDFMAPEAYVVDAYIGAVVGGGDVDDAVTRAYAKYQKLQRPPKKMFALIAD